MTSFNFKSKTIAFLDGSLPDGGIKTDSSVFAVHADSFMDSSDSHLSKTKRIDLDVGEKLVFLVENILLTHEADKIIEITELLGYREDAPGIVTAPGLRQNKSVHWLADKRIMSTLYERLKPHLPEYLDGQKLSPNLSHRLNMYRYDKGDVFNPHIDGDWPGFGLSANGEKMVKWEGSRSKLSLVLYLNGSEDGVLGGETAIYDEGKKKTIIKPKKGRGLLFRHGHNKDTVLHEGMIVTGSIPKYVARINILYDENKHFFIRDYSHD
tara:strand:+ start:239 stop:1039 length:801 start_codon:yes stop_codon:yes gene_type:complete